MKEPLSNSPGWRQSAVEVGAILLLFFAVGGGLPPNVNEAHYLAKARNYWDPAWCAGDLFLESADAHEVFYWSFGWTTLLMPLAAAAWLGRLVTWALLAWAWRRLSWALLPVPYWSLATAALFVTLLSWGHMAGEWVVGGVEAKGFAFVLLFLALEALIQGRWSRVWLLLGAASAFHVLVGGWSVVAASFVWLLSRGGRPRLPAMLPALLGGGLLSLPGLVPAIALSAGTEADVVRAAEQIYVFRRLPHHLVFHLLDPWLVVRHFALIGISIAVACHLRLDEKQRRLARFVGGSIGLALLGIALDLNLLNRPELAAGWLRFYWFRLSDVMVPLAAGFLIALATHRGLRQQRRWAPLALLAIWAVSATHLTHEVWVSWYDRRPRAVVQSMPGGESRGRAYRRYRDWRRMCDWVREHTPADAVFFTPRQQQTFKWHAQRAEVVNWKDIPQDSSGIVQWWRRMLVCYPPDVVWRGNAGHGEPQLLELRRRYGFTYVVIDRSRSRRLDFPRVFPPDESDVFYEVYRLPQARQAPSEDPSPGRRE